MRWKLDLLLRPRDQEIEFSVEAFWLSQAQEAQTEQIHPQTFDDPFFDSTGMIYMHWVPTGESVNKEYYVEVLREFSKRFRRKRPALVKSGQWHFQQDNAPVHNSILLTDYLIKMSIKTVPHPPYSPDLNLYDFHGAFQKLLERYNKCIAGDNFEGDESFMYVLSIKVPIGKKSGNLFNDPRIYLIHISLNIIDIFYLHVFFC